MATRALVRAPALARVGEVMEIRVLVQHPMETGYRPGADGRVLPRDIVRRIEARFEGELVFAMDLYSAIAANPYVAFPLLATASGTLVVSFQGDNALAHSESVKITLA
jgi:sulfur-oxidizing protein SoxZ